MKKNKALYRMFILSMFVLINVGVLFGIGQIIAYLNTGADRTNMLHLDLVKENYYVPEVKWESVDNPGRPMEDANLAKIEQDYLDAWHVKNLALFTGEDAGIYDHYTESARAKVRDLIAYNNNQNIHISSTTLAHHISVDFYSADGTLVVLTDRNLTGVERIYSNDQFLTERSFRDDYRIILLLEDGFWRIRHFERLAVHPKTNTVSARPLDIEHLEGINYYGQDSAWDTFGESFETSILAQDFKIINDLKLNTIRVFIGYEDFGKGNVSTEKINKLITLLDQAQKANLKVMITLFDFYGDYSVPDWTLTNKHLASILTAVKDHPALLAWDIKNEPNLDFETRGKGEVIAWLKQTIAYIKQKDTLHPITIGWSSPEAALHLKEEVDFISYHFYQDLDGLSTAHKKLTEATSKPVILQEFGLSSYHGVWNPLGDTEEDQANYYNTFFKIQKRDSIHYLSWTLFDFRGIPNRVAGKLPWRKNKQAYFGIIDIHGVKDDAYLVIKNR